MGSKFINDIMNKQLDLESKSRIEDLNLYCYGQQIDQLYPVQLMIQQHLNICDFKF